MSNNKNANTLIEQDVFHKYFIPENIDPEHRTHREYIWTELLALQAKHPIFNIPKTDAHLWLHTTYTSDTQPNDYMIPQSEFVWHLSMLTRFSDLGLQLHPKVRDEARWKYLYLTFVFTHWKKYMIDTSKHPMSYSAFGPLCYKLF